MFAQKSISRTFSVLFVIIFIFSFVPGQPARAAGIRYATSGGAGDCTSWTNACTLQTALTGAGSDDEIWVMAGTYKPTTDPTNRAATFQLKSGVALYGGFVGTETARTQRNPAANLTVLSGDIDNNDSQTPIIINFDAATGNYTNSYHVVTGATGATLDGFTITAGCANGAPPDYSGGGMYNLNSNPTLANVTFSGDTASYGGGIYNHSSSPALTNVAFSGNNAGYGAGMLNESNSNPTLTNVTFSGNTARSWGGYGGGMYNTSSSPTLTDVIFNGNSADIGGGGMINYASNPAMTNAAFSNNIASTGGGMYNIFGSPTLKNVTFSGNKVFDLMGSGGGMLNLASNPTLTNVTFSGNATPFYGGGMANRSSSNPTLTNTTFSGNSAVWGSGIYNADNSNPHIYNTILWGNIAGLYADISGLWANTVSAQIYNDDAASSPVVSDSVVQGWYPGGTNIITEDPNLGTLGAYGGFTQTFPLLGGSSAIDTGNDAVCPATDQRGVARPQGVHCDMGAYEWIGHTISGNAGVAGATLSYTDGFPQTANADLNGEYTLAVTQGWSGTVTPSSLGWSFSPDHLDYANVQSNLAGQEYTATRHAYVISGNAGLAGTTLSYTDGTAKTAQADGRGNYAFAVSFNWSGTVTPSYSTYIFTPASRSYTDLTADQTDQDFTPNVHRIYLSLVLR